MRCNLKYIQIAATTDILEGFHNKTILVILNIHDAQKTPTMG